MVDRMIRVDSLGKRYLLGTRQEGRQYKALRDSLAEMVQLPWRQRGQATDTQQAEEFWALRDVSFEIKRGEVVGIIGRNGAGKSTLLKVLSRITDPTEGRIALGGRVASLLEVGTGFHPELTGRENIFLNAAILGMSRHEIKGKFDEIVAFAEVERFLDTPVKRYSSGMYVRLAFAVAAHLEPEILVVDEVLAVGDAEFQKKCLGKMENVARQEGRTILFVSHNMGAIAQLCSRAILLKSGRVEKDGDLESVISAYMDVQMRAESDVDLTDRQPREASFYFTRIALSSASGARTTALDVREAILVDLTYEVRNVIPGLELTLRLTNQLGTIIFSVNRSANTIRELTVGIHEARIRIPPEFLAPGMYTFQLLAHVPNQRMVAAVMEAISFQVEELGSHMAIYTQGSYGVVMARFPWDEQPQPST